jgi:tetratricopeptide (TPR) repeat protein
LCSFLCLFELLPARANPSIPLCLTDRAEPLKLAKYLPQFSVLLEALLRFGLRRSTWVASIALMASVCFAQNTPKVTLETSETIFTILSSMNACGYDDELTGSDPLRKQVRGEIYQATHSSDDALQASNVMCQFYRDHMRPDPGRNLAQYVSLALYLEGPPNFVPRLAESELAPDAMNVVGFAKMAAVFYEKAGLHGIWQRHREAYARLADRYHEPLSKMVVSTEVYLKLPSGYLGRGFTVFLEPMGAPGQVNARNYGNDYYVVLSPGGSELKTDQIRHTYLHYLLDPLSLKYPTAVKHAEPLLNSVRRAPMDEGFKSDISLLINECLIRAIEIRTEGNKTTPEAVRAEDVQKSTEQGFILTRYFYDTLVAFEKDPAGIQSDYPDWLMNIDLKKEEKRAADTQFASVAAPELLHLSRPSQKRLLQTAENYLAAGDLKTAQDLAQQALKEKSEDQGRALFIMARVATANRDMNGATDYFQQALQVAHEPKVIAWSHIYLGRIYDLKEQRETALDHYRAALSTGGILPEVKEAAERGLRQPYEPPASRQ